jgi:hypothetical protein
VLVAGHEVDRRILLIDELEVKQLPARPNARIEVFVLEGQREARQRRVEADGPGEVGGS